MTSLVGMLAGFLPCDQFQRPKATCVPVALYQRECIQRKLATGGFGGQEENFVQFLAGPGFQQGEKRADCLAYSGWRLGDQAAAERGSFVHGLSQLALASAKRCMGKAQAHQRFVTNGPVDQFLFRPVEEAPALVIEVVP